MPAGLQLAAARRAVALAFPSHVVKHHLREKQRRIQTKKKEWDEAKGRSQRRKRRGEKMRRINNFLDHRLHLRSLIIYKHRVLPGASHVFIQ